MPTGVCTRRELGPEADIRVRWTDPATGETIGSLPDMTVQDTRDAIERASVAFKTWQLTSEYDRAAILTKMYQIMKDNAEDLAQIITMENGKTLTEARGEVAYGASYIE